MKQTLKSRNILLYLLGLAISVIPVSAAIISYFPIWAEVRNGSVISGISLVLLLIAAKPIYNHLKMSIRSPSAYMLWLSVFVLFFLLSRIADEMTVIAFVGFVSNALGAVLFKMSGLYTKKTEDGRK